MIFVWKDINHFPPPNWDHVYVTVLDDEDGYRYVTTGYYRPNSKDWIIFKDHYNSPTEFTEKELDAKVIAWQEIDKPKPY